ncbi:MAG: hypothetical protein ACYTFV_06765 [Planctomycetota bacterium]|jgi:hypothetical protein
MTVHTLSAPAASLFRPDSWTDRSSPLWRGEGAVAAARRRKRPKTEGIGECDREDAREQPGAERLSGVIGLVLAIGEDLFGPRESWPR